MKKRIAFLVGSPGPRDPSFERMAVSPKYEIKVFFCRRRQEDQQWPMREPRYPAAFLRNWAPSDWYGRRLISDVNPGVWRALTDFRPEAVVIHGFATVTCLVAVLWARCHRVPFLLRGDSNYLDEADPSRRRNGLRRRFLRWLVRRAAAFLSIGKLNHQFWAAYGADNRRIFFVPLGVDTDYFSEQADLWRARRAQIRAENEWKQNYVLLYVGRLVREKRVDVLIAAMQKLEHARKDIGLLIVGDGVEYDPLADQARNLRNVHFLGFRDLSDLPQYYAIADAFVLPSEIEPWGIVVAEALACGLPIIATRKVGAAWDLVHDGENGYIVPENDAAALAVAIDRACKSNSLASGDREFQGGVADWGIDSYVQGLHAALDYCLPDSG